MKRKMMILLAALVTVSVLTACGEKDPVPTGDNSDTTKPSAAQPNATGTVPGNTDTPEYYFMAGTVKLVPGEKFDAAALPAPNTTFEVPSCAFEGTDKVYNYETYEVTAFNDGKNELIYSVYLIEPTVKTPEGLAVGDDAAEIKKLYGDPKQVNGNEWVYTNGKVDIFIIVNNETVMSIEYRMVNAL